MSRFNADAEASVLSALLRDNETYDRVSAIVSPDDFAVEANRLIYGAIESLILHRQPADPITVAEELGQNGQLESIGGLSTLGDLAQAFCSASNCHRYAEIVRDMSRERAVLCAINEANDIIYGQGDAADKIAQAAELVVSAAETGRKSAQITHASDMSRAALKAMLKRSEEGGEEGLSLGFVDLERVTGKLKPGQLIIVAGRPGMGKSTLARNIAEHVSQAIGVLYVSLEMDADEVAECCIASLGNASYSAIQNGEIEGDHVSPISRGATMLSERKLAVATGTDTLPAIHSAARTEARRMGGIGLIVIDYLQQLHVPGVSDRRVEVDAISRGLKRLAMTLRIPVVALAQLSRGVEQRTNKRPMMSDLRESGGIEADADKVVFLYRDEYYNPDSPYKGIAEAIVSKNRRGKTGKVPLVFMGEQSRFGDAAPGYALEARSAAPRNSRGGGLE